MDIECIEIPHTNECAVNKIKKIKHNIMDGLHSLLPPNSNNKIYLFRVTVQQKQDKTKAELLLCD